MEISYSPTPHNKIDYFPLPNGYVDVFLYKNRRVEQDEEGNDVHVADEVHFQVSQDVTKQQIEDNFDYMWNDAEKRKPPVPTDKERLEALEAAVIDLILGGN